MEHFQGVLHEDRIIKSRRMLYELYYGDFLTYKTN